MDKMRRSALWNALALAVIACCGELSSGRCVSAFYAQAGRWSWRGIGVSCIVYGFLMGGVIRLKRKTGACSLKSVYTGTFGRRASAAFMALHAAFCALAAYALMGKAAETAALALPFHKAGCAGAVCALIFAVWMSRNGVSAMRKAGCALFAVLIAAMLALMTSGELPGRNSLHFYVELGLENNPGAVVLLAVIHGCMAAGLCAAAAVRLFPTHIRPGFAGLVCAAAFGMLMMIGNGVFSVFPKEINALRYPFVALSAPWGTAGFYIFALLRCMESTFCLAGVFCMLPAKHK